MVMATSPRNASAAPPATSAPSVASSCAGPGDRFHTRTRCPAETSLAAMGRPMAPSPRNPISIQFFLSCRARLVAARQQPFGEVESFLKLAHRALEPLDGAALRLDLAPQVASLLPGWRRPVAAIPAPPPK